MAQIPKGRLAKGTYKTNYVGTPTVAIKQIGTCPSSCSACLSQARSIKSV